MFPTTQLVAGSILLAVLASGCAVVRTSPQPRFDFFVTTAPGDDPWFDKVSEWQTRARPSESSASSLELPSHLAVEEARASEALSVQMAGFAVEQKRRLAARINIWSQVRSHRFYKAEDDDDPAGDHWPTFGELIDNNGYDCDGLDLIPYHLLLVFGYPRDRVYRAIVRRDSSRKNHMVTLWFEDPRDPWVLDATGAMVLEMTRFSKVVGWTPTKMFNESEQYKVTGREASESFALVRD